MPIKKRMAKPKLRYSDTIERLLARQPIEWTDEADSALVGCTYFDEPPDLPPEAVWRASELVGRWRDREIELRNKGEWHGIPGGLWDAG